MWGYLIVEITKFNRLCLHNWWLLKESTVRRELSYGPLRASSCTEIHSIVMH